MDLDINTLLEMKNKVEKDLADSGEFFMRIDLQRMK